MMNPSPSSSSTPPNNPSNSFLFDMECNLPLDQLPLELLAFVTTDTLHIQAYPLFLKYQTRILRRYGDTSIQPIGIHPKYPFIHPFYFPIQHWITFPKKPFIFYGIYVTFITLPSNFLFIHSWRHSSCFKTITISPDHFLWTQVTNISNTFFYPFLSGSIGLPIIKNTPR